MASAGQAAWKLAFQLSPILLTRGLAANIPGGVLPIIALTESLNFASNLLHGNFNLKSDDFFAHFQPLPGTTLLNQQAATYPFANQAVAANATIQQPNTVSMIMTCPARGDAGYVTKLATMTAMQKTLQAHNQAGGTYSVVTPSLIFVDCLLLNVRDISGGQSAQVQTQWQWDFLQPLVSLEDAATALNNLMSKLKNGLPPDTTATPASGLALGKLVAEYPVGSSGTGLVVPQ
jgi:hypothetical protein